MLWQGGLVCKSEKLTASGSNENMNRFKFLILQDENFSKIEPNLISENGYIRFLTGDQTAPDKENIAALYKRWNSKWLLEQDKAFAVILNKEKYLIYLNTDKWEFEKFKGQREIYQTIKFSHPDPDNDSGGAVIKYRTHGPLPFFFPTHSFSSRPRRTDEFIETLLTRILMYDQRIYNCIKEDTKKPKHFKNSLFLDINPEKQDCNPFKDTDTLSKHNFIVIHLSYIESFYTENDPSQKYTENKIYEFIDQYLEEYLSTDNHKLIITTGLPPGIKKLYKEHPVQTYRFFNCCG